MPGYDGSLFDPPEPVAHVSLRHIGSVTLVDNVPMLLDTGADVTLLPESFVQALGATIEADKAFELLGFDGTRSVAPSAEVDMLFVSKAFRGRYLITKESCGILGRDVLNHLAVLFDGPKMEWAVTAAESKQM